MAIEWGIMDPNAFQRGYQNAKAPFDEFEEKRKKAALDAVLRQYAMDPNNPNAVNALAQVDPRLAIQVRQQQEAAQLKQLDAKRDSIKIGAQVIRSTKPTDEVSWQRTRQLYAQAGGDLTDVPQHWDETTAKYAGDVVSLADALAPEKTGQLVPYAPGGGVARINPQTGQLENLVLPNEGGHPVGSPVSSAPRVTDQASYDAVPPGSQYTDPEGRIRMKPGGQTVAPSGGFLDPLAPL